MPAGAGFLGSVGLVFDVSATTPHRFEGQLGIGYLSQDDSRSEDNKVSWSRIPADFIYFYRNTDNLFRLGWGLTYHMRNRINAKGNNSSAEATAENALGWLVTAEKLFETKGINSMVGFGLRYQWINYRFSALNQSANANALFLTMSIMGLP